jgi:hypothetical protein
VHEFEFTEYREALGRVFPHVSIFVQNHVDGVVFRPLHESSASDLRMETAAVETETAHFFVAVCAMTVQTGGPTFVYLPTAANVLREREQHIHRLEQELVQKNEWLAEAQHRHGQLLEAHRSLKEELEERNRWADQLNVQLKEAGSIVADLQEQLAAHHNAVAEVAAVYEAKVAELDQEVAARTQWALDTETRLTGELNEKVQELAKCVEVLHETERTLEERTEWARRLQQESQLLEKHLSLVRASRWHRMGRALGLAPEVRKP